MTNPSTYCAIAVLLGVRENGARNRATANIASLPGMVSALRMSHELLRIVVDLAQLAGRVAQRLIVEVRRRGIPALAGRGDRSRTHTPAELDGGDEAVSARAVELSRS